MRIKFPIVLIGMLILFSASIALGEVSRVPWLVVCGLSFIGIFIFDTENAITKNIANSTLFLTVFGLVLKSILEPSVEYFWRDVAGAVFLIALGFEQNSESWDGHILLRSMLTPAVLFFILVMGQSLPALPAEATLICSLAGIFLLALLELFSMLRKQGDVQTTAFMSATRSATSSIVSLFYCATFLPNLIHEAPFINIQLLVPVMGVCLAMLGFFLRKSRERYILFCSGWSLFILWTALSFEQNRIFAGIGGAVAGAWSTVIVSRAPIRGNDLRYIFLKISGWGIPGSILFTFILLGLLPSTNMNLRIGSVIWLLGFFIYWSGLVGNADSDRSTPEQSWGWRQSIALALTIASTALLSEPGMLARAMSVWWGGGK
ncbi:MAG: hypothetical protein SGI74_07395 [Oligoflexia bacterium]|nr:hypothetical protein [Oligoflexia bacterium]